MTNDRTRFGKYELVELLGEGGMASVYRAMLSGPGGFRKQVAIKQIRPHIGKDEKMVQLMFNEARLGGHLRHKNIVEVYEFDQVEDTYYLAIEFVDGFTLSDLLRQGGDRGPIPPRIVANLAMQICQALAYAHGATDEQGKPMRLVHRDLKPANVMVRRDGLVKLADFGIAKAETNVTHTTTGLTRGTPAYMSPEQVTGGRSAPLDHRSDLFSLASIVTELLTGERAFADEQMLDLMNRIASVDVAESLERVARAATPFVPVLRTAFQRLPVGRHDDAAAMGKDIRRIYDRLPPSEERVSVWLVDWMEGEGADSLGPDTPTALVGDDALVNPTPSATDSLSLSATRPTTSAGATPVPANDLPDDARATLETHVEPIRTPPPGEEWPIMLEDGPPGTAAFFDGGGDAPQLDRLGAPETAADEQAPAAAPDPAPAGRPAAPVEPPAKAPPRPRSRPPRSEPIRSVRRRAGPGRDVSVVSVESPRRSRSGQLPRTPREPVARSGARWILVLVALVAVLAVPALAWKLDLLGTAGERNAAEEGLEGAGEGLETAPDGSEMTTPDRGASARGTARAERDRSANRDNDPREGAAEPDDVVGEVGDSGEEEGTGTPEGRDTRVDAALGTLAGRVKIKGCFRKHRVVEGELPPVTVTFVVAPGGALSDARVIRPDDLDAELSGCLVDAIDGMKLMRAAADEPVTRSYTFRGQ